MIQEKAITLRVIGYAASLLLTLAAFFIILRPSFFHLDTWSAILVIFILGIIQFLFQFLFFIDLWREKGMRWNLIVFGSTISIIFIIVFFSIWIMNNLNYNM